MMTERRRISMTRQKWRVTGAYLLFGLSAWLVSLLYYNHQLRLVTAEQQAVDLPLCTQVGEEIVPDRNLGIWKEGVTMPYPGGLFAVMECESGVRFLVRIPNGR